MKTKSSGTWTSVEDDLVALRAREDVALPERPALDPRRVGRDQADGALSRVPSSVSTLTPQVRKSME